MRIGKYQITRELGAGGMGIVYQGFDPEQNRPIAIKMIGSRSNIRATVHANQAARAAALDINRRMMLVREARLSSDLRHPDIVRVFDYGQHAGLLYIVMEYLEGRSLDRIILVRNAFNLVQKIGMIAQICDALTFAHAHGVIHRDIKPANAFVLKSGRVKVLDFGLAAKLSEPSPEKRTFAGTPNYAAPEVVLGNSRYDAKVDIWATGIAFYELLTGIPPFAAKSLTEIFHKICHEPLPPFPAEIAESDAIRQILATALAKDPDSRYASAEEFSADLRQLLKRIQESESAPIKSSIGEPAALAEGSTLYREEPEFDIGLECTENPVTVSLGHNRFRRVAHSLRLMRPLELLPGESPKLSLGLAVLSGLMLAFIWRCLATFLGIIVKMSLDFIHDVSAILFFIPLVAISLVMLARILSKTAFLPLMFLEKLADIPRCHNCQSWMQHKTRWTRFANTETALTHGFNDCVAALKENLWQDAAKLLSIHGDDYSPSVTNSIVSPPIRYHLDFFECLSCRDQSARVTTEDKDEESWAARPQYAEAYKVSAASQSRRGGNLGWLPLLGALRSAIATITQRFFPAFRVVLFVIYALGFFGLGLYLVIAMLNAPR